MTKEQETVTRSQEQSTRDSPVKFLNLTLQTVEDEDTPDISAILALLDTSQEEPENQKMELEQEEQYPEHDPSLLASLTMTQLASLPPLPSLHHEEKTTDKTQENFHNLGGDERRPTYSDTDQGAVEEVAAVELCLSYLCLEKEVNKGKKDDVRNSSFVLDDDDVFDITNIDKKLDLGFKHSVMKPTRSSARRKTITLGSTAKIEKDIEKNIEKDVFKIPRSLRPRRKTITALEANSSDAKVKDDLDKVISKKPVTSRVRRKTIASIGDEASVPRVEDDLAKVIFKKPAPPRVRRKTIVTTKDVEDPEPDSNSFGVSTKPTAVPELAERISLTGRGVVHPDDVTSPRRVTRGLLAIFKG